jgi:DNA-binding transcriptional MerR regulator
MTESDPPKDASGSESMEKSSDAYRTISEAAEELDLPQHVLRFWETRFPQVRPLKRGGGRRFYRPDDLELLRAIRHLLYGEGYTIRGVQKMLKEHGPRQVVAQAQALGAGVAAPAPARKSAEAPVPVEPPFTRDEPVLRAEPMMRVEPVMLEPDLSPAEPFGAEGEPGSLFAAAPPAARAPEARDLPLFHREAERPALRGDAEPGVFLSEGDLRALESALAELEECRRLLHNAAA